MIPLPSGTKIWLVAGITDMRNALRPGLPSRHALKDFIPCPAMLSMSGASAASGYGVVHR